MKYVTEQTLKCEQISFLCDCLGLGSHCSEDTCACLATAERNELHPIDPFLYRIHQKDNAKIYEMLRQKTL